MIRTSLTSFCLTVLLATQSHAACGGSFSGFVQDIKQEAIQKGHDRKTVAQFFASVKQDRKTLQADRKQGVFQLPFTDFARRVISADRLRRGQAMSQKYDDIFDRAAQIYGVPRGVLLAFWALETDYGAFQGNFNTLNSLVTLAHDCRRPDLFRPQVFAALSLYERGMFDPNRTTGAWAGEIGMVQMLPGDILERGVDGDGDGKIDLKNSQADALLSGARMLQDFGWRAGEPWLIEASVPNQMDWALSGLSVKKTLSEWQALGVRARSNAPSHLRASLLLPQGHKGPAFLAFDNFDVYFEWNQSFTYVLTAAYFGTRLSGSPIFEARAPEQGLNGDQMQTLQRKLRARGHDVGKVDGILGARTRDAVRAEQKRLGLAVDAWPTQTLLSKL